MASQSARLWPRAWRTRASGPVSISDSRSAGRVRRVSGTLAQTESRVASARGRPLPMRDARKSWPCSGIARLNPSSPQPFQRRMCFILQIKNECGAFYRLCVVRRCRLAPWFLSFAASAWLWQPAQGRSDSVSRLFRSCHRESLPASPIRVRAPPDWFSQRPSPLKL